MASEVKVVRENVPIQRADWGVVGHDSGWKWQGPTGEVGGSTWMVISTSEVLMVVLLVHEGEGGGQFFARCATVV
jgi:hypothetical protein